MEVLLINPPREIPQRADFPPAGLAYIAATLKQNGVSAAVLDASSFSWKKLEGIVRENKPAVAGVTCWTFERGQSFKTAKLVKEILPTAKIIVGGHHATAFPEHMFKLAYADAVVIGEGEMTTVELTKAFLNKRDLRGIKGIAYQENGKVIVTEPRGFVEDIDSIPFPDYDDFDLDRYLGLSEVKERAAAIITSRGCPHSCIFCSASKFWKRKWRARTVKNVLQEIKWLYKDYGVRAFMFFDDNFTIDKRRTIAICQEILEGDLRISWVACSHVNNMDETLLSWMKKAGCYRIDYGVESGSPKVLKNIKKGQTVERIRETFRLTHEAGIKPRAYLMVGNPGEDESTIKETIDLMGEIKPYDCPSGHILCVLPDTEIYALAKSKGIISDEYWLREDSTVYYTGEHRVEELKRLRALLMKGLLKDRRNIKAYAEYLARGLYYRYPILQKARKWRKVVEF